MEQVRNSRNFENFKAKSDLSQLTVRSGDGTDDQFLDVKIKGIEQSHSHGRRIDSPGSKSCCQDTKALKFPSVTFLPKQARAFESRNCDLVTTTKDSHDEISERCNKLSQKTYFFFKTMKAKGNLSAEKSIFRENSALKVEELSNGSNEEHSSFQHVGSSKFTKYNKSSSSADRSTVEITPLNEKSISGANNVPASSKDQKYPTSSSLDNKMKTSGEIGIKKQLNVLQPDNNIQSSSTTPKLRPKIFNDDQSDTEATSRWIKRLKLISSSPQGSKTSKLAEEVSHDKKAWKNIRSTDGKEREDDKDKDVVSHNWIKRFQRNEVRSVEEVNKKELPSIAAMAMVGRTINGHGACELRKKGPITFWSTQAF